MSTSLSNIIQEKLEECAAEICDKYCKYPSQYTEEEWDNLMEENKSPCNDCPFMKLL